MSCYFILVFLAAAASHATRTKIDEKLIISMFLEAKVPISVTYSTEDTHPTCVLYTSEKIGDIEYNLTRTSDYEERQRSVLKLEANKAGPETLFLKKEDDRETLVLVEMTYHNLQNTCGVLGFSSQRGILGTGKKWCEVWTNDPNESGEDCAKRTSVYCNVKDYKKLNSNSCKNA